jgi:hypothetical protein
MCFMVSPFLSKELGMDGANNGLGDEFREPPSIHDEMEKRLKMDW